MSKSTKIVTTDYVTFEPSYCHRLATRMKQLSFFSRSNKFSLEAMKNKVYEIVQDSRVTDKYVWFLNEVKNSDTKAHLYFLCRNSVKKAEQTIVDVKVKQ